MERKEDREILRRGGFAEGEMKRLSQLRKEYTEREKRLEAANHRRLEFVRWLVSTGNSLIKLHNHNWDLYIL